MGNDPLFPAAAFLPLTHAELVRGEERVTNDNGWLDAVSYDDSEAV
jgi:hypothetical protein